MSPASRKGKGKRLESGGVLGGLSRILVFGVAFGLVDAQMLSVHL